MKKSYFESIYIVVIICGILVFYNDIADFFVTRTVVMFSDYTNSRVGPFGLGGAFFVSMKINSMVLLLSVSPIVAVVIMKDNVRKISSYMLFIYLWIYTSILVFLETSIYYIYMINVELTDMKRFDVEKVPYTQLGLITATIVLVSAVLFTKKLVNANTQKD